MSVSVKNGKILLSVNELLENLSTDEKRQLADSLSCEEDIIRDVTAQLLDGWTDAGSHGSKGCDPSSPHTALDIARREIALRAGDVAREEIDSLMRAMVWSKASEDKYRDWAFRLYHSFNKAKYPESCPQIDVNEVYKYKVVKREEGDESSNSKVAVEGK